MAATYRNDMLTSNQTFNSVSRRAGYLREELHCCQISSRSDLKRRQLDLFWWGRLNKNSKNKMS